MKLGLRIDGAKWKGGTISIPYISIEMSLRNHFIFHNGCMSGHILKSTNVIEMKLGL